MDESYIKTDSTRKQDSASKVTITIKTLSNGDFWFVIASKKFTRFGIFYVRFSSFKYSLLNFKFIF
jgi:hypothetical protein